MIQPGLARNHRLYVPEIATITRIDRLGEKEKVF
ncbi:unnamed protein product, partial [marine sediment metagenome]